MEFWAPLLGLAILSSVTVAQKSSNSSVAASNTPRLSTLSRTSSFIGGASSQTHVTRSSPESSITSAPSLYTSIGSCTKNCAISFPSWISLGWSQETYSTVITAATVAIIVNTKLNTTRTTTRFVEIPSGYTLPPMNEHGTHIRTETVWGPNGQSKTITLAYPTTYFDYNSVYHWAGQINSTSNGQPVCIKATGGMDVTFRSHPPVTSSASLYTDPADPRGLNYYSTGESGPMMNSAVFPELGAFAGCNVSLVAPAHVLITASFLFETTTEHDDSGPSSSTIGAPNVQTSATALPQQSGDTSGNISPTGTPTPKDTPSLSLPDTTQTPVVSGFGSESAGLTASMVASSQSPQPETKSDSLRLTTTIISVGSGGLKLGSTIAQSSAASTVGTLVISSSTITYIYTAGASVVAIGSQTLTVGGAGFTAVPAQPAPSQTRVVSLGPEGLDLGSTTLRASSGVAVGTLTQGSSTITITLDVEASTVVIGTETLSVGGAAATYVQPAAGSTQTVSLGSHGLDIGTSTIRLPSGTTTGTLMQGTSTITYTFTAGASTIVIGAQTLSVGGPEVVITHPAPNEIPSSQAITLGPQGLVIGGSTVQPPSAPVTTGTVVVDSSTIVYTLTEGAKTVVVGDKTLTAGGSGLAITQAVMTSSFSSQTISLGSNGLVIGSSTVHPSSGATATGTITKGSSTITYTLTEGAQTVVIGDQTLTAGGSGLVITQPVTTSAPSSQVISLAADGLIIGTSTVHPSAGAPATGIITESSSTLIYTYTSGARSVIIGSHTLIIGGSALTVAAASTPTSAPNVGSYIASGIGGAGSNGGSTQTGTAAPTHSKNSESQRLYSAKYLLVTCASMISLVLLNGFI